MGHLTLSQVRKSFGATEIIKGIDLDVADGEFVVLVGPSGCGKSTLLRIIAGLETASAGGIVIDGRRVDGLPPVKRGVAMVFQSYALYPHMTVFENIAFPLRVDRTAEAEVRRRVEDAARILHLEGRLQQKPGVLSGGQRQRVAIGRAIVREPRIFLFDEPLSNLDAALRSDMRVELATLHRRLKATMIYVTHDQVEAMTMADRIVVLDGGGISQVGAPLELYHKPANAFVARFIGNPRMNMLRAEYRGAGPEGIAVSFGGKTVTVPVGARPGIASGDRVTLGVRPEHVGLGGGDLTLDLLPAVVERLGAQTVAYAGRDEGVAPFCAVLAGDAPVAVDRGIAVGISAADCHLFDRDGHAFERRVDLAAAVLPAPVAA